MILLAIDSRPLPRREASTVGPTVGRDLAMTQAGQDKLMGETAMLALWSCADGGPTGLAPAERARIIQALRAAGLDKDARNFAIEGLLALK